QFEIESMPCKKQFRVTIFKGENSRIESGWIYDSNIYYGGKLGMYVFSQQQIIWTNLEYNCLECTCTS
ncbi:hypothetical protein, partial [Salmonella sp. s51228]|uniref:hypothetical protein n=1 Tax=Salmonella sp. s51228 TaxID=3159652 RepID=UPI0039803EE3